jgi:hypothetical protein
MQGLRKRKWLMDFGIMLRRKIMVSPVSFVSLNLQRALQLLGLNHIYQELKGLALAYGNLSGIEIGNWVDSMIGGEIVIIDQGRAPEVSEAHPAKGKAFQTTELVGRAFERNVSEIWSWLMKDGCLKYWYLRDRRCWQNVIVETYQ